MRFLKGLLSLIFEKPRAKPFLEGFFKSNHTPEDVYTNYGARAAGLN